MTKVKHLRNRDGEQFYPVTSTQAVYDVDGNTLEERLAIEGADSVKAEPTDKVLGDIEPNIVTGALRKTEQALSENERKQVLKNLGNPEFKLFVDMWDEACGEYGSYDPTNAPDAEHPFYLNELWLTYEEAIEIMLINGNWERQTTDLSHAFRSLTVRTLFPIKSDTASNIDYLAYESANLEAIAFDGSRFVITSGSCYNAFYKCKKLRKISGIIDCFRKPVFYSPFKACESLEEITIYHLCSNLSFEDSPRLSLGSINTLVSRRDGSDSITITLHPDAYARVTDELFALAAEKNITIASV